MFRYLILFILTVTMALQTVFVHAGFIPYGRIFKAAKDDRTYITQAHDSRLQLKLHKELLLNYPTSLSNISSYVYLGHAFLVGEVQNDSEREQLIECAKNIQELSGVSYYLPLKKSDIQSDTSALEIKLKALFETDFPSSKLTIKVVQNAVILLGVLDSEDQQKVNRSVKDICGSDKIVNFLQIPPSDESKKKRVRPLRNLF